MSKGKIFTQIDLCAGFGQLGLNEEYTQKTACVSSLGLFDFVTMPFGLKHTLSMFQRAMEEIFKDIPGIC